MNNKLNLFALIDRASRGSDLQWEEMLDTELGSYKKSFIDELGQMSKDIRARINEDLQKNKFFYEKQEEPASAVSISKRRLSILRDESIITGGGTPSASPLFRKNRTRRIS